MVINDDMPHSVPPVAYLRYKETWFFLILEQKNDAFLAIHVVGVPEIVEFRLTDINDQPFTIEANLAKRHAPLACREGGAYRH